MSKKLCSLKLVKGFHWASIYISIQRSFQQKMGNTFTVHIGCEASNQSCGNSSGVALFKCSCNIY